MSVCGSDANAKGGKTENLIEGLSLVVVRIYPSRAGRFLSIDVSLVEIIPVPDERILVKEKASVVDLSLIHISEPTRPY